MKKIIIVLIITLFCFGCAKEDKNIIINIYENGDQKEVAEADNNSKLEGKVEEILDKEDKQEESKKETSSDNEVNNNLSSNESNSYNSDNTIEYKSKLEEAKDWYNENKDELSDINKEILEEDKNTITNIIDGVTSWYEGNKEELGDINKEILEGDKNVINDLLGSASSWYQENKNKLSEVSEQVCSNDKETLVNLYNNLKNIE